MGGRDQCNGNRKGISSCGIIPKIILEAQSEPKSDLLVNTKHISGIDRGLALLGYGRALETTNG